MRLDPPPSKDEHFYRMWALAHDFCQGCGRSDAQSRRDFGGIPLSTHHFIKQHRAHEACVLLRLCWRDHALAENERPGAIYFPAGVRPASISIGLCMTLKMAREPEEVDWDRCRQLRGSNLPDFAPVPAWLEEEFRRNRPRDRERWFACR